jgi:SAM-dependent methyltransferase
MFDRAAESYDRARPQYPSALFDDLERQTGVAAGDRVLEIGCGSGKATRPLADRGLRITCVELGPRLATRAQAALAEYPDVEVVRSSFEAWRPPDASPFDLVVAATSWHWIDPGVRYRKAFDLLRPGGHLAFWSAAHVFPNGGDPFFRELQDVYDEIGEGLPPDAARPRPGELPDQRGEIAATGLYDVVGVKQYDWQVVYDAEGYIELLDTFSGHIAMAPWGSPGA